MKNTAMVTKVLVLLVSVLMVSTTLYAGQPARSTSPGQSQVSQDGAIWGRTAGNQISTDGAIWGFCRNCGTTADSTTNTVNRPVRTTLSPSVQAEANRNRVSNYLQSLLGALGVSQEGAIWGYCGRFCSGE